MRLVKNLNNGPLFASQRLAQPANAVRAIRNTHTDPQVTATTVVKPPNTPPNRVPPTMVRSDPPGNGEHDRQHIDAYIDRQCCRGPSRNKVHEFRPTFDDR